MKNANCIILKKLGILFAVVLHTSLSDGGDFKVESGNDLQLIPGRILTDTANNPTEYLKSPNQQFYIKNKNDFLVYSPEIHSQYSNRKGVIYSIENAFDQVSGYFFKYFFVEDYSSKDPEAKFLLKSKIRSFKQDLKDFDVSFSFDIGYYRPDAVNVDAIRIESFFNHTFVTTIYHYEKKEIEVGLSNVLINNLLLDGMKLEIQANPYMNTGAVVLTMTM